MRSLVDLSLLNSVVVTRVSLIIQEYYYITYASVLDCVLSRIYICVVLTRQLACTRHLEMNWKQKLAASRCLQPS